MTPVITGTQDCVGRVYTRGKSMKRILILILALTTLAAARDKKSKAQPGPYIFTTKASAQSVRALIVQQNLILGYTLDSDKQLEFRFSMPAQMPLMSAVFVAASDCPGMITKKVWSYTLEEHNGMTRVTVEPVWQYPDDYCKLQTQPLIWSQREEIAAFQAMLDNPPTSKTEGPTPPAAPVSPALAAIPATTTVGHPQSLAPAPQTTSQPTSQDESSSQPTEQAKQHAACLELAKDNPSITCK
jgi:hypothetical protein